MARLLSDGFETNEVSLWTSISSFYPRNAIITASPTPRTGTYAWRIGSASRDILQRGEIWGRALGASVAEVYGRIGLHPTNNGSDPSYFLRMRDSASGIQMSMTYDGTTIYVYRGDRSSLLGSCALSDAVWHTIHFRYKVDNSAGIAEVWVDGAQLINVTGADTQQTSNANVAYLDIASKNSSEYQYSTPDLVFDDIAINDTSGSHENAMPGMGGFIMLKPNGNGTTSGLTGSDSDSTDNYALVDEFPADSADYVGSATAGLFDTYAMEDVPGTFDDVVLIQPFIYGSLAATGTGSLKIKTRMDSVDYDHDTLAMALGYARYAAAVQYTAPDTTAWSVAKLNALEFGVEVV